MKRKGIRKKQKWAFFIGINQVCYFPGDIMSGKITFIYFKEPTEKIVINNQEINITVKEIKYYSCLTGSGKHRRIITKNEETNLINMDINSKISECEKTLELEAPFSLHIPDNTSPSINFIYDGYVRHLFIVELKEINAKRATMFAIKNNFPSNLDGTLLKDIIEENKEYKEYKKSKLFYEKGSCLLNFKMPKNYFFYNEKIPFEINLDCSNLKMLINSIRITLLRRARRNNSQDYSKIVMSCDQVINRKFIYINEEGLNNYHFSDFIEFPTSSKYNSVYPPNVYKSFEDHGFIEISRLRFKYCLYPSTFNGLITVDYYIDLKLFFNNSFTFDEEFLVPIYFSANFENNDNENTKINQELSSSIP